MLLYLQIALTILSAICVALVLPFGVWLGFNWAIALALAALMFFAFMKLCKQSREFNEKTKTPQNEPQDTPQDEPQAKIDEEF